MRDWWAKRKEKSASRLRKSRGGIDVVDVLLAVWAVVAVLWLIVLGLKLYLLFAC